MTEQANNNQPSSAATDLLWSEEWVPLSKVIQYQPLQVRRKLDKVAVGRYANMTKEGTIPPPIKLARCEGRLYLLDGWHRMAAGALQLAEDLMEGQLVRAMVASMSPERRYWEAARSNVANGVQYKPGEYRALFRAFIKAKQHHKGRRVYMSYREMAQALGVGVSHVTLRSWTLKDQPALAAALSGGEQDYNEAGTYTPEVRTMEQEHSDEAHKAMAALSQHAAALGSAENRWTVLQQLEATAAMLRAKGVEEPMF
jgi:hypothetical protein